MTVKKKTKKATKAKSTAKKPAPKSAKAARAPKAAKRPAPKASAKKAAPKRAAPTKAKRVVRKAKRPSPRPSRAKLPKKPKAPPAPTLTNPIGYAVAQRLAHAAVEKKATDVSIIETGSRSAAVGYDYIVLATGDSDRQLTAIADAARELLKPHGKRPLSVEVSPDWVAMDFGDVVAHLFLADRRGLTDIEGMWTDTARIALAAELPPLPLAAAPTA